MSTNQPCIITAKG